MRYSQGTKVVYGVRNGCSGMVIAYRYQNECKTRDSSPNLFYRDKYCQCLSIAHGFGTGAAAAEHISPHIHLDKVNILRVASFHRLD